MISGTMGVGKTSVSRELLKLLPGIPMRKTGADSIVCRFARNA